MRVLNLHIRTWLGTMAIGAQHHYGTLYVKSKNEVKEEIELKRPMTPKERKEYNAQMIADGCPSLKAYKGQTTNGFFGEQAVRDFALKIAKEKFPDGDFIIIEREQWACSARPVLYAPEYFKAQAERMNQLDKELQQAEREKAPNARLNEIDDEFDALVEQAENYHYERTDQTEKTGDSVPKGH